LDNLGKRSGSKFESLVSTSPHSADKGFGVEPESLAGRKKVLLVLSGNETDHRSLKYAINTAQRTDAALEILVTSSGGRSDKHLEECRERARKALVGVRVEKRIGCMKEAVVSHAKKRRDILCVVVESTDTLSINCVQGFKKLDGIWKHLGCPLVMVSET